MNNTIDTEIIDTEKKQISSDVPVTLTQTNNRNKELLSKALKITENELKQLDNIQNNINLANQRKQELVNMNYQNYVNDIRYKNNIISIHNDCINYANQNGIQFWKEHDNSNIYYRINKFTKKYKFNTDKELYNLLGTHVKIYDTINQVQLLNNTLIIIADYLTIIKDEIFNPENDLEWLTFNNLEYKNTFQYSSFLEKRSIVREKNQLEYQLQSQHFPRQHSPYYPQPIIRQEIQELYPFRSIQNELRPISLNKHIKLRELNQQLEVRPSIIKDFIKCFSKDNYQFNYIMNWLAHFFQTLNKSDIALVLIGDKETTDILINNIIRPIFAYKQEYFCVINDDTLKKPNETVIKDKIFYHIDEISTANMKDRKTSKLLMNIIKSNATDLLYAIENSSTYIYGETIVTSSYESPYPFLKDSYSRCSVFSVKHMDTILKQFKMGRLEFEENIQNDLSNFSNILATYPLDNNYFNIAQTEEKDILPYMKKGLLLTQLLESQIQQFIQAIKEKNIKYFTPIKLDDDKCLYKELIENFDDDAIYQPKLSDYFNIIYEDIIFQNNSDFIEILKEKECLFNQSSDDKFKSNGLRRYKIYSYKLSSGYKGNCKNTDN